MELKNNMNDKNIRINLGNISSALDKEQFGMLIDAMIEQYANMYGVDNSEDEPEKPIYDCENITDASTYLKKFRL